MANPRDPRPTSSQEPTYTRVRRRRREVSDNIRLYSASNPLSFSILGGSFVHSPRRFPVKPTKRILFFKRCCWGRYRVGYEHGQNVPRRDEERHEERAPMAQRPSALHSRQQRWWVDQERRASPGAWQNNSSTTVNIIAVTVVIIIIITIVCVVVIKIAFTYWFNYLFLQQEFLTFEVSCYPYISHIISSIHPFFAPRQRWPLEETNRGRRPGIWEVYLYPTRPQDKREGLRPGC